MNIEISNEQIEKLVEVEVHQQVDRWFSEIKNKYVIRDYVLKEAKQYVLNEIYNQDYQSIVKQQISEFTAEAVLDKVAQRISEDIAAAYADKYGGDW